MSPEGFPAVDKNEVLARLVVQEKALAAALEAEAEAIRTKQRIQEEMSRLYDNLRGEVLLTEGRAWGYLKDGSDHIKHFEDWNDRYTERAFAASRLEVVAARPDGVILKSAEDPDMEPIICSYDAIWHPQPSPPEIEI